MSKVIERLTYSAGEDSYNGVYRMSQAGVCKMALSLWRLGYSPQPFGQQALAIMREGNIQENLLIEEMKSKGIEVTDRQKECWITRPTFSILGHLDGKIEIDNALGVLEIKALGLSTFLKLKENDLGAFPVYMVQCALYMAAENAQFCLLIAKCRDNAEKLEIYIEPMPTLTAKILEKLEEIESLACEGEVCFARYDITSPECRFCRWKQYYCAPQLDSREITSPDLITAAESYRAGHELRRKGELLENSAKTRFREYLKAEQIATMRVSGLTIQLQQRTRTSIDRKLLEQLNPDLIPQVTKRTSYELLNIEEATDDSNT